LRRPALLRLRPARARRVPGPRPRLLRALRGGAGDELGGAAPGWHRRPPAVAAAGPEAVRGQDPPLLDVPTTNGVLTRPPGLTGSLMPLLESLRCAAWALRQQRVRRMAPEQVQQIQQRRLRRLLRLVGQRSPFYRDKYRGLDLARCRLADLPPTSKTELMAHFDRVVTDPAVRRAGAGRRLDHPP